MHVLSERIERKGLSYANIDQLRRRHRPHSKFNDALFLHIVRFVKPEKIILVHLEVRLEPSVL